MVPNTFKEAMTLPAKVQWKVTSDKEVVCLKIENSSWMEKVKRTSFLVGIGRYMCNILQLSWAD